MAVAAVGRVVVGVAAVVVVGDQGDRAVGGPVVGDQADLAAGDRAAGDRAAGDRAAVDQAVGDQAAVGHPKLFARLTPTTNSAPLALGQIESFQLRTRSSTSFALRTSPTPPR